MASRRLRFHPEAEAEFAAAAECDNAHRPGLGARFVGAVRTRTTEILEAPQRWRIVSGARRVLVGLFPYVVVYRETSDEEIEIVAIAHLKRRPRYLKAR